MGDPVLSSVVNNVCTITLNRPDRHNAVNHELQEQLWQVTANAINDVEVRSILLRGEGPSFSSGFDTGVLGHQRDEGRYAMGRRVQEAALRLVTCPKPIVAAMKGHTLGVGLEFALAADMRIVAKGASLGFPEVLYGLCTDNGGAALSTVLAGPSRAKYLLMTGERIGSEQAFAWGLADWVVEPDELDDRARDLAEVLASRPPMAVSFAKQLVDQVHRAGVTDSARSELLSLLTLYGSEDQQEARAALREERAPRFTGK